MYRNMTIVAFSIMRSSWDSGLATADISLPCLLDELSLRLLPQSPASFFSRRLPLSLAGSIVHVTLIAQARPELWNAGHLECPLPPPELWSILLHLAQLYMPRQDGEMARATVYVRIRRRGSARTTRRGRQCRLPSVLRCLEPRGPAPLCGQNCEAAG